MYKAALKAATYIDVIYEMVAKTYITAVLLSVHFSYTIKIYSNLPKQS